MEKYLEAGKIINTHGIRGEVKIEPWADSPEFLKGFKALYIDSRPVKLLSARAHGRFVIAKLEGVDDMNAAEALKNRIVYIDRDEAPLSEGEYFISDLIGFTAVAEDGEELGKVTEILSRPAGEILVITGEREILVPLVPEFVIARDMDGGRITLRLIEGM
ncbi:MAG: 16S rRNA processing protein RimM [Oscillospiraceae bacterium]|nr:16S rRNA processing protein RimM [Oscillospiraceae bacterium]